MCLHLRKNGYPLRIGILCDKFQFNWPFYGFSLSTGPLKVNAPVYMPHWVEFNIHSPAAILFTGKPPIISYWRKLVIETDAYLKIDKKLKLRVEGLEISSFEEQSFQKKSELQTTNKKNIQKNVENKTSFKDVHDRIAHPLNRNNVSPKITAEFLKLDLNRKKNQLEGQVIFDDFDVSHFLAPYFTDFPKLDGNLKWTFDDVDNLFEIHSGESWTKHLYGASGLLQHGELTFQTGGIVHVSGPFSFDDEGYLSAEFKLSFFQQEKLFTTLQHLFPAQARSLQTLFFILNSLPKNEDGSTTLSLQMNHGWIKLGFLKLGRLSPI